MTTLRRFGLVMLLLSLAVGFGRAEILSTGIDTGKKPDIPIQNRSGVCRVLWFGQDAGGVGDEIARLAGLGFAITQTLNPADVNLLNLMNYDVLVVAYIGPGTLGANQGDIQTYVTIGGSLLIHQPNAAGTIDYAPAGFEVTIQDPFWCNFPVDHAATIVNGAHPVTAGLANADLSGALDLVASIGGGYTLLARNAVCNDAAVAAGTLGLGNVVFEDGNANPISIDPGSDQYWTQVFNWLCSTGPVISVEGKSWGGVKTLYK